METSGTAQQTTQSGYWCRHGFTADRSSTAAAHEAMHDAEDDVWLAANSLQAIRPTDNL
jgi:hypothetical protein